MTKLTNNKKNNPCAGCHICFMGILEDCSFCSNFSKACEYNGTTVEQILPWVTKTSK